MSKYEKVAKYRVCECWNNCPDTNQVTQKVSVINIYLSRVIANKPVPNILKIPQLSQLYKGGCGIG
jgi:hypothetical protein